MPSSCHFCKGRFPLAFVFSVPGGDEKRNGKPIAGDTGENLDSALVHLHSAQPRLFPSLNRYDYRITNAFPEPIAVALGHNASEARDSEVKTPRNIQRVLSELEGCNLVVLCGNKARLLAPAILDSGRIVIEVPHVGNKGLNGKYAVPTHIKSASSFARRKHRVQLWASAVLQQAGASQNAA
jgi:uracil-DNA glycosylase